MKYDKYGDPIGQNDAPLQRKQIVLFAVFVGILVVLILLNAVILIVPFLNLYLCFITAPLFLFMYIGLVKAVHAQRENGTALPGWIRWAVIGTPILYAITAILAILGG